LVYPTCGIPSMDMLFIWKNCLMQFDTSQWLVGIWYHYPRAVIRKQIIRDSTNAHKSNPWHHYIRLAKSQHILFKEKVTCTHALIKLKEDPNLVPKNIEIKNTKLPEWKPYWDKKNNYSSFHATLHNATLDWFIITVNSKMKKPWPLLILCSCISNIWPCSVKPRIEHGLELVPVHRVVHEQHPLAVQPL
jgi:hypothetical protein